VPLCEKGAGSPSNTTWPGPRPTRTPSLILIRPTVWPQCTNVTDRTGQDNGPDSIGRTVLPTVAQKPSYTKSKNTRLPCTIVRKVTTKLHFRGVSGLRQRDLKGRGGGMILGERQRAPSPPARGLGSAVTCRAISCKHFRGKPDSLEPLVMLVKFLPDFPGCSDTQNTL